MAIFGSDQLTGSLGARHRRAAAASEVDQRRISEDGHGGALCLPPPLLDVDQGATLSLIVFFRVGLQDDLLGDCAFEVARR